jgi:hypothetical protein
MAKKKSRNKNKLSFLPFISLFLLLFALGFIFFQISKKPKEVKAVAGTLNISGSIGTANFPGGIWNSSGNVGIGTTNPGMNLQISSNSTSATTLGLTNTSAGGTDWKWNSVGSDTAGRIGNLELDVNGVRNVMTIQPLGNVGIGTTGPTSKLEISGGSLRLPASGYEGAGQIQSTGIVRIANGSAAQEMYVKQIAVTDSWSDADSNKITNGVYSKGGIKTTGNLMVSGSGPHYISSGNVGIGTTAPGAKLHIQGGKLYVDPNNFGGTAAISLAVGDTDTGLNSAGDGALDVYSNNVNAMSIRGGKVGIGTTMPMSNLSVGTSGDPNAAIYANTGSNYGVYGYGSSTGVYGYSSSTGVYGYGSSTGIYARSDTYGVYAWSSNYGVYSIGTNYDFYAGTSGGKSYFAGNVGIGTTAPTSNLTIGNGKVNINGTVTQPGAGSSQYNRGYVFSNLYFDGANWITSTVSGAAFNDFSGMYFSNGGALRFVAGSVGTGTTNLGGDLASYSLMTILPNGNVGIGTTSPGEKLTLDSGVFKLQGNYIAAPPSGTNDRCGNDPCIEKGTGDGATKTVHNLAIKSWWGIGFWNQVAGQTVGTDRAAFWFDVRGGKAYAYSTWNANQGDLAEMMDKDPSEKLEPGDIVQTLSNNKVTKTSNEYSPKIIGVVSVNPGFLMGGDDKYIEGDPTKVKIGVIGKIPVKIVSNGEKIDAGSPITSADIKGFGQKMIKAGLTIGKTTESFEPQPNSCPTVESLDKIVWPEDKKGLNLNKPCFRLPDGKYVGKIIVYVNTSYYDPDVYLTSTGDLNIAQTQDGNYQVQNSQTGGIITRLSAFAETVIGKIRAGLIETKKLIVDGVDILKKLNELSAKVESQQKEIESLKEEIKKLKK